jgi:hypothetical protein
MIVRDVVVSSRVQLSNHSSARVWFHEIDRVNIVAHTRIAWVKIVLKRYRIQTASECQVHTLRKVNVIQRGSISTLQLPGGLAVQRLTDS